MNDITLKSIRRESIRKVLVGVLESDMISRAALSKKTDLSLVTIGKIADILVDSGIVIQSTNKNEHQVGRKAGIIRINPEKFAVLLDLSTPIFKYCTFDLKLSAIEVEYFSANAENNLTNHITSFLTQSKIHIERTCNLSDCIGIGIILPGIYHESNDTIDSNTMPELCMVRMRELIYKFFPKIDFKFFSESDIGSIFIRKYLNNTYNKTVMCLHLKQDFLSSSIFYNEHLINGAGGCNSSIGNLVDSDGIMINSRLVLCRNESQCADVLTNPIYSTICLIKPHAILIDSSTKFNCDNLPELIATNLMRKYHLSTSNIPTINLVQYDSDNLNGGLIEIIRDQWINKILLSNI